ncbi:hypothetical protein Poly30_45850 [Planctomycetes bacterium Poly30]|uniref:Aminoglycoside phosphotransferase domain-containing protein n=1 Tax=Saltatorellus ferox TaxID=2528018 RepID=A0A518EY69_9BACT|nr:hypothetical protein Poly30_45850 [Planctomycetes bacterium Poly30]
MPDPPNEPELSTELAAGLRELVVTADTLSFKTRLERLVHELPPNESDALMMLMKESRGAWALLLEAAQGRALFIGDALSGTPLALATLGFQVTVLDRSFLRSSFAVHRGDALAPDTTTAVLGGDHSTLPFRDRAFEVVVLEGGLPSPKTGWPFRLEELRRVAAAELVVTADNRMGYKRSTGRRGDFRRDPRVLVRELLAPSRGEATLPTTRALVQGAVGSAGRPAAKSAVKSTGKPDAWPSARAFSLYPHALEFSHVVALDADVPRLTIGPRERKNRLKMIGHGLGLFRWLTPSFAIHARRRAEPPVDRLTRLLERLAGIVGEEPPVADIFVATRSNDALIHTAPRQDEGAWDPRGAPGRWTLHFPLQPAKRKMVATHHDWLARLRREFPSIPVPEPLFVGELEGTRVAVERRLGGLSGTDVTGDLRLTRRMFQDAARHMACLLDETPTHLDEDFRARLLTPRFDRVERLIRTESTARKLKALRARVEERLIGSDVRLGVYHADLRGKHVQVDETGSVLGYLDWGASEESFLPFVDLLHLVVHQRKQEVGGAFGDAWRALLDPRERRPHEQEAFDAYLQHSGLGVNDLAFYLEAYPLFVAGMAERNWDYSRPDWVRRQFGIF